MTRSDFNVVQVGEYVLGGKRSKAYNRRLLVREKYPDGVRLIGADLEEHYLNYRAIQPAIKIEKEETA